MCHYLLVKLIDSTLLVSPKGRILIFFFFFAAFIIIISYLRLREQDMVIQTLIKKYKGNFEV